MAEVLPVETPALGDRSYLVHDGDRALVIDPQRDIDRVLDLAAQAGVRITHVAETHLHNDYVTGGLALARETGADYLVSGDDPVTFDRTPVADGDQVDVSDRLSVRVLATPGHTFSHLAYAVADSGTVAAVFTGGSLLYGANGRTDLLGPDHTSTLTHAQWASARRLARELPDAVAVFPTHGFGSFCAAGQPQDAAGLLASTIGQEKLANPALTLDEPSFVESLLAGLDAWPAYYAHMAPANRAGPGGPDLSPPRPADPDEIRCRLAAGEWVVDLRARVAFAASHVAGTFSFPLENTFATYLGWLIPWGTPLTLLGESPGQVAQAQRELVRIGIDRPAAAATGGPGDWAGPDGLASLRLVKFGDLAAALATPPGNMVVLDVRLRLERAESHIPGSVHIPLHELPGRLDEVPPGEVWVHCGAGYRSTVAASMLAAHGRQVVAVDDDFANAGPAGLTLASG